MMGTSQKALCLGLDFRDGAPELPSSVALAPHSKGVGTSEELILDLSQVVNSGIFQLGEASANQTQRNHLYATLFLNLLPLP